LIPAGERGSIETMRTSLPVEFTHEALDDVYDIVAMARVLSRAAESGRVACGQSDPRVREMTVDLHRVIYRIEESQVVVLGAEPSCSSRH
jgi:uncharacterized protein YabN with tetrapyrrole methylase and pyrophosphatase domain